MSSLPTISHHDLLACAVDAAERATRHAVANRHRREEVAVAYDHDVKLNLDGECQEKAQEVIRAAFPSHPILGEEGSASSVGPSGDYLWILDPIDGTVNFSHGLPFWCCAVAVRCRGETVAGCVLAPDVDRMFTATAGSAALCNGEAIAVSRVSNLDRAMVLTGLDDLRSIGYRQREILSRLAVKAQKVRIMGSAALDLCRIASGEADGYFEAGVFVWDVEAAGLITRCAGGRAEAVRELALPHQVTYIASNGHIHDELKRLVMVPAAGSTE